MAQKMICSSCGAEFDENLEKCPYCDTLNLGGAESAYMTKLGRVDSDMAELGKVPQTEVRRAIKSSGRFVRNVLIIILACFVVGGLIWGIGKAYQDRKYSYRTDQEEYLWQQTNFQVMDRMYEEGKYEELYDFLTAASEKGHSTYTWKHTDFCMFYEDIRYALGLLEKEEKRGYLSQTDYTLLLYAEWKAKGMDYSRSYTEEDRNILAAKAEPLLADFEARWDFSEEEYAAYCGELQENNGYIPFDHVSEYVKNWYKAHIK